jgi:hypothetical protein
MAYSPIEQRYIDMVVEGYFPAMPTEPAPAAEEVSLEGVQLAAGPSKTRTDAPAGVGLPKAPTTSDEAAELMRRMPLATQSEMIMRRIAEDQKSGVVGAVIPKDMTLREKLAAGMQQMLIDNAGMDNARARRLAQTMFGGESSGAPLGIGLIDITPAVIPLATEEAGISAGEAREAALAGDYGTAALKYGTGVLQGLDVVPGVAMAKTGVKAAGEALAPVAGEMVEGYLRKTGGLMDVVQPGPNVVSTRLPTAVKATEDPLQESLIIDLSSAKRDPEAFAHNVGLIRQYPNFVSRARNPDRAADDFINTVKDNLLYLYDKVPEETRKRSKLWYNGARNITDRFAGEYGIPDQAVSGVLAVLSPQKDWFMNVSLGQRVIDIAKNQAGRQWDSAMDQTASRIWTKEKYIPIIDLVRGKSYAELKTPEERALWLRTFDQTYNPREHQIVSPEGDFMGVRMTQGGKPYATGWGSLNEIGKAIAILDDPSIANVSTMLGQQHKVRNFYNNIYAPDDPMGHVTIDTHAVAAGLLRPLSGNSREVLHNFGSNVKGEVGPKNSSVTGVQGTYGLFAEAYRRAAAERGVLPREMQSITWEAVRGLFPDTFKTERNSQLIDSIWLQYKRGQLSLEEARDEVIKTAGGIRAPEWERAGLRGEVTQSGGAAVNQGELPGSGVSRGGAGRSGRNKPAAGNQTSVTRGRQAPQTGAE